ncbi:methyltransferase domain-containing protein [Dermacoccaceae bacterium W4C1]
MPTWDPAQYEQFDDLRNRPFFDLTARVSVQDPPTVVDLGCGNGPLTLSLTQRWPQAQVTGVDSSAQMLARARELDTGAAVRWVQADVAQWQPDPSDLPAVIVTNATLQWVPGHEQLITDWLTASPEGTWFAMQVPGNFDAPSHVAIREVAAAQPNAEELLRDYRMVSPVLDPDGYADLLAPHCDIVDAWETTYLQILDPQGEQQAPVLEWVKGTALRPLLDKLEGAARDRFLAELTERLAAEYPRRDYGVPFGFRRVFAVGRVGARR